MNYLAHAYLSFGHPHILTGNMISDFVKGKKQYDYPVFIQKGIRLHRMIDQFTDHHPVTREAKKIFAPAVGAYSGAFVDVAYDHFLALDACEFSENQWKDFSATVYRQLYSDEKILPEKFARILPYMSRQNWLYNYRFTWGIENSFGGLARRAKYLSDPLPAFQVFTEKHHELKKCYADFFPQLKAFALSQFELLVQE